MIRLSAALNEIILRFFGPKAVFHAEGERSAIVRKMFGEAAEHNLRAGIALPVITLGGAIVGVSLGGETVDMPPGALGMISMISTFAIARAIEIRGREKRLQRPRLTPREIECLKWAADGKTEWEISSILHVSEHTADKHLVNAHRKLGAANRAQAPSRSPFAGASFRDLDAAVELISPWT